MSRISRSRFRKPSPALFVAVLALFVALGGPAAAARTVKKALFAKEAASARKVDGLSASKRPKPNTLLALDKNGKFPASVGLTGPRGVQGPQGLQGVQGPHGFVGAPGSAIAYSRIFFDPPDGPGPPQWRADDQYSKGIDNDENFDRIGAGEYCFHDLNIKINNVVATLGGTLGSKAYSVSVDFGKVGDTAPAGCNAENASLSYALIHVYDTTTNPTPTPADPVPDVNEIYVAFN